MLTVPAWLAVAFDALWYLTHLFWVVALAAYALRPFVPALDSAASYGRLATAPPQRALLSEAWGWRCMYLFAALLGGVAIVVPEARSPILVPLFSHVLRRAYECFMVHKFTERPMANVQLLFALGFYFCAVTGPFFSNWRSAAPVLETNKIPLFPFLVIMWCELQQNRAHKILALCRGEKRHDNKGDTPTVSQPLQYTIPQGGLFAAVSSPHYLTEIVFYVTLLFVGRFYVAKALMVAFVVVNLADRANRTHQWYKSKFGDAYPADRNRLIPFVW